MLNDLVDIQSYHIGLLVHWKL